MWMVAEDQRVWNSSFECVRDAGGALSPCVGAGVVFLPLSLSWLLLPFDRVLALAPPRHEPPVPRPCPPDPPSAHFRAPRSTPGNTGSIRAFGKHRCVPEKGCVAQSPSTRPCAARPPSRPIAAAVLILDQTRRCHVAARRPRLALGQRWARRRRRCARLPGPGGGRWSRLGFASEGVARPRPRAPCTRAPPACPVAPCA
jgi:hypothetical protein